MGQLRSVGGRWNWLLPLHPAGQAWGCVCHVVQSGRFKAKGVLTQLLVVKEATSPAWKGRGSAGNYGWAGGSSPGAHGPWRAPCWSPVAQSVPLARRLSSKVDSTQWAGTTGGLAPSRVILGLVWPTFAPLSNLGHTVTTDGSRQGAQSPNDARLMGLMSRGAYQSGLGAIRSVVLKLRYGSGPTRGPPACCLLARNGRLPRTLLGLCKSNC